MAVVAVGSVSQSEASVLRVSAARTFRIDSRSRDRIQRSGSTLRKYFRSEDPAKHPTMQRNCHWNRSAVTLLEPRNDVLRRDIWGAPHGPSVNCGCKCASANGEQDFAEVHFSCSTCQPRHESLFLAILTTVLRSNHAPGQLLLPERANIDLQFPYFPRAIAPLRHRRRWEPIRWRPCVHLAPSRLLSFRPPSSPPTLYTDPDRELGKWCFVTWLRGPFDLATRLHPSQFGPNDGSLSILCSW
ncbi:hypothetical protein LshimejAT787_0112880 [Lyophyllum shimeji]|uniref:Uncharacterized protein n=1 Tax=Lyophyllum shimeji TaxID=47721 RepID=A0A9P3UHR3_LYOSH|nr:hypothetical protein LshimejAT787_0112880 [Lyophyllum shimeji]